MAYPEMPTDFWEDEDRIGLMWHYVRWFIEVNQIWIMLAVALFVTMAIVVIIVNMFSKPDDNEEDEVEFM